MIFNAFKTTLKRILLTSISMLVAVNLIFYVQAPKLFSNWWLIPVEFFIPLFLAILLTPIEYFKLSNYPRTQAK